MLLIYFNSFNWAVHGEEDISFFWVAVWHHKASLVMSISDYQDRFRFRSRPPSHQCKIPIISRLGTCFYSSMFGFRMETQDAVKSSVSHCTVTNSTDLRDSVAKCV